MRKAAQRLLEGAPLAAVVAQWRASGLQTPLGKEWVAESVKQVLRNPRICGYRSRHVREVDPDTGKEHVRMEVVRDASGEPVIGQFEPILTVGEWQAVTAIIGSNAVRGRGTNARIYLLTGTLRCGKPDCGHKLRAIKAHESRVKTPGLFYYACESRAKGGCGGVSIPGGKTDEFIAEAVIAKYELEAQRREARSAPSPWAREAELAQIRQDIADLTAAWRARPQRISSSRYFAMLPELEREEQTLSGERDAWLAKQYAAAGRPVDLRAKWPKLGLAEKRAYIEDVLAAVLVYPAGGKRGWNPERLEPIWRED
ncbi:hypothetical protein GCM10023170_058770 [Phytohabitans houttuyneae]|uniref:Recombinase domain-containing protein n=1 Tax=Phytohabitans houttuyneae TaxID=1076126 RepID=A0A6V8JYG1_9ACTN|nr:hypothetical protein Phou_019520 [Phytohabitans houttuyneae]